MGIKVHQTAQNEQSDRKQLHYWNVNHGKGWGSVLYLLGQQGYHNGSFSYVTYSLHEQCTHWVL